MLDLLAEDQRASDPHDLRLFAHEAVTPLALALRGRFTRLLCSEYAAETDAAGRARLFPIPVIDVMRSGLPDAVFDVVLSVDVFEHVPDLDAALRDTARILRPGGRLIASVPFLFGREQAELLAVAEGGVVRHLAPPQYHGNPADPDAGALVFRIPAWDLARRGEGGGVRAGRDGVLVLGGAGINGRRDRGDFHPARAPVTIWLPFPAQNEALRCERRVRFVHLGSRLLELRRSSFSGRAP